MVATETRPGTASPTSALTTVLWCDAEKYVLASTHDTTLASLANVRASSTNTQAVRNVDAATHHTQRHQKLDWKAATRE